VDFFVSRGPIEQRLKHKRFGRYDLWGNLAQVSMPRSAGTQTRTLTYAGSQLQSATNPETGTVRYYYNPDGTLYRREAAKGQVTLYYYDSMKRPHADLARAAI
jgi:YD repeat-containing protein